MDQRVDVRIFCHQCRAQIHMADVAHVDLYVDVCWIQCTTCAEAFGNRCGIDRRFNPNPHGYFDCPYRLPIRRPRQLLVMHRNGSFSPAGEPDRREGP